MKVNITDYFSKKNKGKSKKQTANEFTNIKDIRDYFLYTNDGYIMSYIQVFDFNMIDDIFEK